VRRCGKLSIDALAKNVPSKAEDKVATLDTSFRAGDVVPVSGVSRRQDGVAVLEVEGG
jgi:hypothetical protein